MSKNALFGRFYFVRTKKSLGSVIKLHCMPFFRVDEPLRDGPRNNKTMNKIVG
ncbi:hypothetical protein EVA_08937 [gut metagenome]|uniref:Uncharacterized protein n=1 Tax=gut metagenome TaxID=749906 RepID=J9CRX9_9ZZZZ